MKRIQDFTSGSPRGSALVLTLVFVTMFSVPAVALATLSGTNLQVAENHCTYNNARACAESGLEVIRHRISTVAFSGTTAPEDRFARLAATLTSE